MRIKGKALSLIAGLTLVSAAVAGLGADAMRTYDANVEQLRLASTRAFYGERLNRLVTAVVMESRGIYASRTTQEARNFAKGLVSGLHDIDKLIGEWEPIVRREDAALFDGVKRSAAEFKLFRTETARLGTEVSPQAANEQGNNEANRSVRKRFQEAIDNLTGVDRERLSAITRDVQDFYAQRLKVLVAIALLGAIAALGGGGLFAHVQIVAPLRAVAGALQRLAAGDRELPPHRSRSDEIGDIWRTMKVFAETIKEAEDLRQATVNEQARRLRRQEEIDQLVGLFGKSMGGVFGAVARASIGISEASTALARSTGETETRMEEALEHGDHSAASAQSVASASEELSASIGEIARQVRQTSEFSDSALQRTTEAVGKIERLHRTAQEVGAVLELISHIASQTNLLALNATIESARAGEAGKGFAVVAQEVKLLANQTGMATSDIAAKIEAIRAATGEVAGTIAAIDGTIQELRGISASVAAAVEEQAAATQEIARAILQVSTSTGKVADSMTVVREAAQRGSATVVDVKQTAAQLSAEADLMSDEVRNFLTAMKTFAETEEFLIHDVELAAEARAAAGTVPGRVTQISIAFILFSGPLAGAPGSLVELRVDGFDQPLQGRLVGPSERGVHVQLPLTHEHMAFMRKGLASLASTQAERAQAA
jgi:methyl-accepting chemotaxis protein